MRSVLTIALIAAAAVPAAAQTSAGSPASVTISSPPGRGVALGSDVQFRDVFRYGQDEVYETNIRRAGAWGRCVAEDSPGDAQAYLAGERVTQRLRWNFNRCLRHVGGFTGSAQPAILRASLTDALRTRAE
jgi:hypothetical protein